MWDLLLGSPCSPHHQLRLYHFLSAARFSKEIKKGHCFFLSPWHESIYYAAVPHSAILPIREWMESQSRDAFSVVSYYLAGGPEYCTKINLVPSDGIFNLWECGILILAGKQMDNVEYGQATNTDDCKSTCNQPIKMAGPWHWTDEQER